MPAPFMSNLRRYLLLVIITYLAGHQALPERELAGGLGA